MNLILSVAAGGAVGAVARHLVNVGIGRLFAGYFPLATLLENIVGSVILGILVALAADIWSPSANLRGFLMVGMLGSFTTFSAFSLDSVALLERGAYVSAGLYIGGSVAISLFGFFAALAGMRHFLS